MAILLNQTQAQEDKKTTEPPPDDIVTEIRTTQTESTDPDYIITGRHYYDQINSKVATESPIHFQRQARPLRLKLQPRKVTWSDLSVQRKVFKRHAVNGPLQQERSNLKFPSKTSNFLAKNSLPRQRAQSPDHKMMHFG